MNRLIRTLLFIFFAAVFAVVAPGLALYAQGYRINWPIEPGKKLVVKTGGVFIKTSPKQADVYINAKLSGQTDFFFGSVLLENLLPGSYKIEVVKTGCQSWEKNLEIKEKEVIELKNIFLFPWRVSFSAVEKNIDQVLISPDRQKIGLKSKNGNGWNLKLYDINKNITSKLVEEKEIFAKGGAFNQWEWLSDSKKIKINAGENKTLADYLIAVDKNPAQAVKSENRGNETAAQELAAQEISGNRYYLDQNGFIFKKDAAGNAVKISSAQIDINNGNEWRLWVFGDYFFVKKNSELFALNQKANSFEKIFDGLSSDLLLSPDAGKIVYCSDSEIWIFFSQDSGSGQKNQAGEKVFIARFSQNIRGCDWFNSDYLIFVSGGKIKTAEIDRHDKINIVDLAEFSEIAPNWQNNQAPEIFWSRGQKSIYAFLNSILYKSDPIE